VVFIHAGHAISSLHSWRDLYSWQSIAAMVLCTALTLVPVLVKPCLPSAWQEAPHADGPGEQPQNQLRHVHE